MLFDTHAHLTDRRFDEDREEAWQHFVDSATPIDYSEAFSLKAL